MINSFIILNGISASQSLPVGSAHNPGLPQQVTVEDGAQGAKPVVLTYVCLSLLRPGRENILCSCPGGCLLSAYRQSKLSGLSHVLDYRGGFT